MSDPRTRRRALGALAVVCIALQFPGDLRASSAALVAWLAALAWLEPALLQRLWRPRFIVLTLIVALLSGQLLGRRDAHVLGMPVSTLGLRAGALMVVRGTLIWAMTTWCARLLDSGHLMGLGRRVAGGAFTSAVATAIRLVPELTGRLKDRWEQQGRAGLGRWSRVRGMAGEIVLEAARLAETLAAEGHDARPWETPSVDG